MLNHSILNKVIAVSLLVLLITACLITKPAISKSDEDSCKSNNGHGNNKVIDLSEEKLALIDIYRNDGEYMLGSVLEFTIRFLVQNQETFCVIGRVKNPNLLILFHNIYKEFKPLIK